MPLNEYVGVVRGRWWIVLIATLVSLGSGYLFASAQTPIYRSSVRLEVTGRIDYGQILAIDKLLRQISSRITTTSVAEAVDQRLQLGLGAEALLAKIHTQALSDTIQIQVDVDDTDPIRAQRIAGALAEVVQERQAAQMASVPEQERVAVSRLDRPSPGRFVWPQTQPILLAAGLLGLLAGMVLAFLLDYLDDTMRSAQEIERYLSLPVLGTVPPAALRPVAGGVGGQSWSLASVRLWQRLRADR